MITDIDFLNEVVRRTGCSFEDLGFDPDTDIDNWIEGEENARDAVTKLIMEQGLDDLTDPWMAP